MLWVMELDKLVDQLDELSQPDVNFDQNLTLTKVLTLTLALTWVTLVEVKSM